jgi:hypothetical protein
MKKILLLHIIIALLLSLPFHSKAQTTKGEHDISISYGLVSGRQIADGLTQGEDGGGNYESSHSGNVFINYRYFFTNRFALGVTGGFQNISGNMEPEQSIGGIVNAYSLTNLTFAAELTTVFLNSPYLQLYVLFGLGGSDAYLNNSTYPLNTVYQTGYSEPATGPRFNFQLDPIALRVGGKLSFFMELGIGYKGIVNTGLTFAMGRPINHRNYGYR